jgi:hypothetical protein
MRESIFNVGVEMLGDETLADVGITKQFVRQHFIRNRIAERMLWE